METILNAETVWEALAEAAARSPDRIMYIYREEPISFREVDERTDRIASGLLALGIEKGDRIGLVGLNQPEWLYTYFAAAKIGAVIVALSPRYRDVEIGYMLNQSGARALVCVARTAEMNYVDFFRSFRRSVPSVTEYFFVGGKGFWGSRRFEDLLLHASDRAVLDRASAAVKPDDLVMIIYTSGTTGKPKGASLTHRSQLASARAQALHTRLTERDSILAVLPFNHVSGITCTILAALLSGGTCVLVPVPDLDEIIHKMDLYRPTVFGGVPALYKLLFLKESFRTLDTSGVRLVVCGGANAEPDLLRQLQKAFPNATVMNLYGLSETSGGVVMSPWDCDFEKTVRSVGKPLAGVEVRIVDPAAGTTLGPGQIGELCFRGPCAARGYFGMPAETREAFDPEGWVCSGDMGYLDSKGYLFLMGRRKEMYIQGGFNVYPVEVENLLCTHPKVCLAAGIGIPDPIFGEVGRYYVVPEPGTSPTEEELKAYCRQHLADYKVPREIVFRRSLPMTPAGKVMKSKLREEIEDAAGSRER